MYVCFLDPKKAYDRVNREALWPLLRMYDVGGKLLNSLKSVYVSILACDRVKESEGECFRIDNGVRQVSIMSPWLFNVYMNAVVKQFKMGMERREESGYSLSSCMQMSWFYVVSRRKT